MATRVPIVRASDGNYEELPSGDTINVATVPTGTFINHGGRTAPSGFIACNRPNLLRASYPDLFAIRCEAIGTATITIATPGVVTVTGHGLAAGDRIFFETTGALPTGLSANTEYFVISAGLTTNDFQLSATVGGSAINTSGSQSGVHTLRWCPDGIADATHFYGPDVRGISFVGAGAHGTMTKAAGGAFDGGSVGATRNDQMQGHYHSDQFGSSYTVNGGGGANITNGAPSGSVSQLVLSPSSDGTNGTPRTGNETRPAQMAVLVCIKT